MNEPKALEASQKHSPLPWREEKGTHTAICDAEGNRTAYAHYPHDKHRKLIVRAVNSYEANKARLEVAEKMAEMILQAPSQIELVELARKFQEANQ